jgi:hypothetical protein
VSDREGSLLVRVKDEHHAGRYHQGSGQAELLICRNCGVLVGALFHDGGRVHGAVNARVIEGPVQFGAEQPVSPKKLAPPDKVKRWQDLWFADVSVIDAEG